MPTLFVVISGTVGVVRYYSVCSKVAQLGPYSTLKDMDFTYWQNTPGQLVSYILPALATSEALIAAHTLHWGLKLIFHGNET